MKIKHFAGYGSVNAKLIENKIGFSEFGEPDEEISIAHIKVWGNHERGIYREDYIDIFNWLCKRFVKGCTNYSKIIDMKIDWHFEKINGEHTEVCDYFIAYYNE